MEDFFSCRQASRTLGVSVSTIKRMCDEGSLPSLRTLGGHRRIPASAIETIRKQYDVGERVSPGPKRERHVPMKAAELVEDLLRGDQEKVVRYVRSHRKTGANLAALFDELFAPAMWQIGRDWESGKMDVYQEHLCSGHLRAVLSSIRSSLCDNDVTGLPSVGCSVGGEQHDLASLMIELCLREQGWNAQSLGGTIPVQSLSASATASQARMIWISYTYVDDWEPIIVHHNEIADALPPSCKLVIGGQALTASVRRLLQFDFVGDSFAHMTRYAQSLLDDASHADRISPNHVA